MTQPEPAHRLFLQWMLFAGLVAFAVWMAWAQGFLAPVFENDPTHLSKVIVALFLGATGHCALRAWFLSRQLNEMRAIRITGEWQGPASAHERAPSLPAGYFHALVQKYGQADARHQDYQLENAQLTQVLAEQARGPHETGWFVTGILTKLGLIGTVIGFVLMLGSVSGMESFDVDNVQQVLQDMTIGMGVALNTTLVGLLGSMLLGFQYLMLDRAADRLVADAVHYAEVHLLADVS